ncbi:hypothetical protein [Cupriavidus basilensis]|uniref:hypothetical protein n=1 Tax=Cupriavidus basilensis TaxID=68895 RepID=UPI0039F73EAA
MAENIALIQDLHTAVGDLPLAKNLSGDYQKFAFTAQVMNHGKPVEGLVTASIKALEHRGDKVMQNPAELARELAMQSQVYLATNGKVGPQDYFKASQTGKIAYQLASPEFLYGAFAAQMQQRTGPTAGTTLMSFDSALVGGHMDKKAKGFLSELGMWDTKISPEQAQINKLISGMSPAERKEAGIVNMPAITGGLRGDYAKLAASNPDQFILQVLEPAIKKHYGENLTPDDMALLVAKYFNRATADFIGSTITSAEKIAKDTAIFRKTKDFKGSYDQYLKSPEGAEIAADAAWKNFLAMFGSIYLPTITKGLLSLAGGLTKLSDIVDRHRTLFGILAYSLLGLSLVLAFGGTVMLLTAAMRGLGLALAMNAIGGAAGIGSLAASIGGAGARGLVGALGLVANPIGIVVLALGTLAAAAYAFRPLTQSEIDGYKTEGGAKLTPSAQARVNNGELLPESQYVKPNRSGVQQAINARLYLTADGKKAIANSTAEHLATGMLGGNSAGSFDNHVAQATPQQGY